MKMTLREIASILGGKVVGDENVLISDIKGLDEAGEGDLTFIANPKYEKKILTTRASAVLVSRKMEGTDRNLIIVPDPYAAMAAGLRFLYPEERRAPGISPGAYVEEDARVAESATLYPGVYVGRRAFVGGGTVLYPGVSVGDDAAIGEASILYPNVTIYRRCVIGNRVILHAGVVVGSDGFGFAQPGMGNIKIPQVGIVRIDDDVEIGANTTIDRGTLGRTWIQKGVKIDNGVQIAHNVVIGENSILVAHVGIAGSTKIGKSVLIGGQAGLTGHIHIGDRAMIAARSGVTKNVPENVIVSGAPHMPHNEYLRLQGAISRLPLLRNTVKDLVKRIEELEKEKKG
jgi:UDP-3-O-[3-hydroxymyristoyl] glucosamine N-acyltransferase